MIVRRSALVDQPAEHLFDLIEAAEHYPAFLPWCAGARILCRDDALVSADIEMRYAGVGFTLRTRNPKRRPEYMAIHLEQGPFRRFEGEWRLRRLDPRACRVDFLLDYDFDSPLMTRVAGPMFDRIANTMVDAFVARAGQVPAPMHPPAPPDGNHPL
jgi:ribosome-associated toxin RatA of RatAB toxin-antitoxin module